jgi:hypothetical protein
MTQPQKKIHLLPFLHLIAMLALSVWWGVYFWHHTPSRELFQLKEPTRREVTTVSRHPSLVPKFNYLNGAQGSRFALAARAAVGDLSCGLFVLGLIGLASGVYVRRFDTWLNARTSGQAVAFRGQNLTAAALDANVKKQRGVLQ